MRARVGVAVVRIVAAVVVGRRASSRSGTEPHHRAILAGAGRASRPDEGGRGEPRGVHGCASARFCAPAALSPFFLLCHRASTNRATHSDSAVHAPQRRLVLWWTRAPSGGRWLGREDPITSPHGQWPLRWTLGHPEGTSRVEKCLLSSLPSRATSSFDRMVASRSSTVSVSGETLHARPLCGTASKAVSRVS